MRSGRIRTLAVIAALALFGLGLQAAAGADGVTARAMLKDAGGNAIGMVRLSQEEAAVLVRAVGEDLPAGFHGFHVHSKGECIPPFTSALGHFNPTGTTHGAHAGDMPTLLVMDDGTAALRFRTDRLDVADLFDADGSAIIVHAIADNHANIPTRYHSHTEGTFGPDSATLATGDSGGRIACGVIEEV
jgi:Cu-Zn family superoxide dismutase